MMNKQVEAELNALYDDIGEDTLKAKHVVEWARKNKKSALHKEFEWDDAKAAQHHRLTQARGLMMMVKVIPAEMDIPTRLWVSVTRDRYNGEGGGYRKIGDVMDDTIMANMVILEALQLARRWSFKYQHLLQLRDIHKVIAKVADKLEPTLMPAEEYEAFIRKQKGLRPDA